MKMMKKILAALLLTAMLLTVASSAFATTYLYATTAINMRKGAGVSKDKVCVVYKGCKMTKLDSATVGGQKWYKVKYNGKTGWVCAKYTRTKSGSSSSSSYKIVATGGKSYIRKSYSKTSKILTVLPKGATATYKGSTKKDDRGVAWYKISYKGYTGWVSSKYTTKKKK